MPQLSAPTVLTNRVRQQSEVIVGKVLDVLRDEVSDYVGRDDDGNTVQDNVAGYLAEMLDWIDLGAEPGHQSFDSAIRHRASQGLTLSSLLHAFRLGAATIWDELARLADTDEIDKEALIAATPSIFAWMNTNSLRAHAVFREIDIRDARRNEQVRAALLDTILFNDSSIGAAFWDAVAALGLPRTGQLTVVAATSAEHTSTGDSPPDIETLISSHSAVQDAWFRLAANSQVGVVSLRRNRADALDSIASTICSDLPVLVGLSSPFAAISDCSKARAQAQIAMAASTNSRPITRYNRDVLPVLLASAPDAAATVVATTLGPVLDLPPDRADPLLTTVHTWLRLGQSVSATAAELHCHRNTVNYRLRRFTELTGRPLTDNFWLAQVALALEAPRTQK
ncbi:PucR family transcriptional regulator [Mycolicibacterium sphagni]|uniref:PucR family transcriptional regulator n=1 Tax=Mycolicibacterium sphagni TaxID=1786 RepID=UPI001054B1D8|nr:PucR family transcriptional regulator [Mycolicibacterium sphagni]MCV7174196.1 helix-turn-helix domain-containing protein [Mycolicibacterium sphagni]